MHRFMPILTAELQGADSQNHKTSPLQYTIYTQFFSQYDHAAVQNRNNADKHHGYAGFHRITIVI